MAKIRNINRNIGSNIKMTFRESKHLQNIKVYKRLLTISIILNIITISALILTTI